MEKYRSTTDTYQFKYPHDMWRISSSQILFQVSLLSTILQCRRTQKRTRMTPSNLVLGVPRASVDTVMRRPLHKYPHRTQGYLPVKSRQPSLWPTYPQFPEHCKTKFRLGAPSAWFSSCQPQPGDPKTPDSDFFLTHLFTSRFHPCPRTRLGSRQFGTYASVPRIEEL